MGPVATFCTKDPFCDSEQPNINVNVQSIYNYTALNLACMAGKTEVVKQLLQVPSIESTPTSQTTLVARR